MTHSGPNEMSMHASNGKLAAVHTISSNKRTVHIISMERKRCAAKAGSDMQYVNINV